MVVSDELSRSCRRRRPDVRGKVAKREVGLVPHRGDDRSLCRIDCLDDFFFVERHQVFGGAASPCDDDRVKAQLVRYCELSDDRIRACDSLHRNVSDDDVDDFVDLSHRRYDVTYDRAARRRQHADL